MKKAEMKTPRHRAAPPPAVGHPLVEGDFNDDATETNAITHIQPPSPQTVPLTEGVANGRGRLLGEAPEPLPVHRALYNPHLRPTARTLRKRMTKAEVHLWKYVLRAGQMKGYTFNRQRPVLRYIADFMCKPLRLIIEVDGSIHDDPAVQKHDVFRQSELEACGFSILRFSNDEVLHTIDSVRNVILKKIIELEISGPFPERPD